MFYNTRNSIEQDEAWAHHDPRGAQDWAHNRPWASLGPSWPKGGPKLEPRIGPGQAWAYRGLWGAQVVRTPEIDVRTPEIDVRTPEFDWFPPEFILQTK